MGLLKECMKNGIFLAATGSKTTIYNVQDSGDPNDGVDPATEETEKQFLIKWKNWAHIHNTWESYKTLKEQKVHGLKKLDNYVKKQDEIREWYVNMFLWVPLHTD